MKWESLDKKIPYLIVFRGTLLPRVIYQDANYSVTVRQPGRHPQTQPIPGGDFSVWVQEGQSRPRQMTFQQVVDDVQAKRDWAVASDKRTVRLFERELDRAIRDVAVGLADPVTVARQIESQLGRTHRTSRPLRPMPGLSIRVLLVSLQAYALAEARRYGPEREQLGGGRKLLPRVLRGVLAGKWTAAETAELMRRTPANRRGSPGGLPALEALERLKDWRSLF